VADFLGQVKNNIVNDVPEGAEKKKVFMLDIDLVDGIKQFIHDGRHNSFLERPSTVQKIAASCGWYIGEDRIKVREWNPRGHSRAKLIASTPALACMTKKEHAEAEGVTKLDVVSTARDWRGM